MAAVSQQTPLPTPVPDQLSRTTNSSYHTTGEDVSSTPRTSVNLNRDRPPSDTPIAPPAVAATTTTSSSRPPLQSNHTAGASISGSQKSGGLLAFASAAIDKTFSNIAEPRVRPRQSLSRLSIRPDSGLFSSQPSPPKTNPRHRNSPALSPSSNFQGDGKLSSTVSLTKDPPSQPYSETDPTRPQPIHLPRIDSKMHQTSSRLLRMTDDDRPFTRDFKDLFGTLIVSLLPLSAHRVRLTKIEHTFLSEDAINNLGSLKFSQSNRMPDPKDPSRIVTTTTTTTFSMARDMARSICQRFVDARFIESADGRYQQVYNMKGSVWKLTPKGVCILDRFCSRNGIQQKQVAELVSSCMAHLVILERESQTDKLVMDRDTIEVIFRRFIGANGTNVKSSVSSADSDSLNDYRDGLTGVKMAAERKVGGKTYKDTFTGKAATDWLMDCCTTVDRRETYDMAAFFVEFGLLDSLQQDRSYMISNPGNSAFQPTKNAIYQLTSKGRDLINGALGRGRPSESEGGPAAPAKQGISRDSNTQRLDKILNDAALRLLFRENLRETHCEENLSFYIEVDEFVRHSRLAIRSAQKSPGTSNSVDGIKEIMAQAYGIYNAFLAPGSPCELNIDHQLRNNLATRMTKAVGQDVAMIDTLHEVMSLFEDAQNAVFKLMASDSVPKFLRSPKYEQTLKNYDFDAIAAGPHGGRVPERSQSRSNRK